MTPFTPVTALIGGVLIGLAAVALMMFLRRIAGISGIVGGLLRPSAGDVTWRIAFIVSLVFAPLLIWAGSGTRPVITIDASATILVLGGLLVGIGTRIGAGCTSGHGVCGMARVSKRSIVATVTFITVALMTVAVVGHVLGRF